MNYIQLKSLLKRRSLAWSCAFFEHLITYINMGDPSSLASVMVFQSGAVLLFVFLDPVVVGGRWLVGGCPGVPGWVTPGLGVFGFFFWVWCGLCE